jgi:hypothetical protein
MIQTGIKLQNIVDFLHKNLNIIIVVPAFIGGLWQALELMNIDYSYIRFFSISQIVPDGILILMVFMVILSTKVFVTYIDSFHSIFFDDKLNKNIVIDAATYENTRKSYLIVNSLGFIIVYFLILFSVLTSNYRKTDTSIFINEIFNLYFYLVFLTYFLKNCYFYAIEIHKKYCKYCNVLLLVLYVLIIIYYCKPFHKIFITPDNNINIENIKEDFSNKFPKTKQEILYFNDKYIFINIIDKSKKEKVYITKLDDLFEN